MQRGVGLPTSTVEIGSNWLQAGRHLVLRVPSVVCPPDHNVLLNPLHPRIRKVSVLEKTLFEIDRRLFS